MSHRVLDLDLDFFVLPTALHMVCPVRTLSALDLDD